MTAMNKVFSNNSMHDMLRLASHELLTPVAALKGLLYLMRNHPNELLDNFTYIELLEHTSERIHRIVKYVLLNEQLKKGINISQTSEETLVNQLFLSAIIKYTREFKRETDLFYEISLIDEVVVMMPNEHLSLIVEELILNAIRFSSKGDQLSFSLEIDHSKDQAILTFKDEGVGMKGEEIMNIDEYVQFNRSSQEQQGIGLGLYLVKKLIDLYNGEFHILSTINEGTTVIVKLPITFDSY
jgi:signal transduction histidine kinase